MIKDFLGRLASRGSSLASTAEEELRQEVEKLQLKVKEQRVVIKGLSMRLSAIHGCREKLKATWPDIHQKFFPTHSKRKKK